MIFSFPDVFKRELQVVNFRRRAIKSGEVAAARHAAPARHFLVDRKDVHPAAIERNAGSSRAVQHTSEQADLTGLALSGGGIRSASFSLGVLQALDSLTEHQEPHVLDAVDYLSTVSGGGYIGTSLVAALMQPDYKFPFDSLLGDQEPPGTQHLRDFSNFLAPDGLVDYLTSAVLVFRGLVVNAAIVLPVLLLLAIVTASLYTPDAGGFAITIDLLKIFVVLLIFSGIVTSLTFASWTMSARRVLALILVSSATVLLIAAVCEFQPFVLDAMLQAMAQDVNPKLPPPPAKAGDGTTAILGWVTDRIPYLAAFLVPVATMIVSFAQRLANVAKATVGAATWSGFLSRYASRFALYLAAVIVPFLLWVIYIYLSFWCLLDARAPIQDGLPPEWMRVRANEVLSFVPVASVSDALTSHLGRLGTAYLLVALVLGVICLVVGPNSNSLHKMYRDRLSRAFLFERTKLAAGESQGESVDKWTFSSLKPGDPDLNTWEAGSTYSPYLLVNTAINLEGSPDLNKRGRNADSFTFSPLHIGSRATGYVASKDMENVVKDLSLATAMATSGAAASANMGRSTIRILTFSLAMLNVSLGYWLANPRRLDWFATWFRRRLSAIGIWSFVRGATGYLTETSVNVYLTDGGHIENLGIYELLQRRCKVIVAVDAEADQDMTFPSLVNLQVMARIDLGIRIDLPWLPIQTSALGITSKAPHGPAGKATTKGPHAAIGRIEYSETETGVLIYIKSSMSGDENDYIADYKRRNGTFPHETTVDQFFTEDQFEVYRALGFHAARGLFTGADSFGTIAAKRVGWMQEVENALHLLNVPSSMAKAVARRC